MKESTKKKLSESLKRKWASGTRKPNPEGYGKKIGRRNKELMAKGLMRKRSMTTDQAIEYRSKADPDKIADACRRTAKKRIGTNNTGERNSKNENHWKGKYWKIKNTALGVTLEGKNLNNLIRENGYLFDQKDIRWKKHRCRASRGIRNLFEIRKSTGQPYASSWKGWTIG